jgi:Domain of Unknown Function (DUF349)
MSETSSEAAEQRRPEPPEVEPRPVEPTPVEPTPVEPPGTEPPADSGAFGRVDADGTVYVRTAAGERAVGSWHAGDPQAGLAHFARRYDELATRVRLLHERLVAGTVGPGQAAQSARELRGSLPTAAVVGDLDALGRALDAVDALVAERRAGAASQRSQATERRRGLVEEAERLASSSDWTATGERFRAIVEEWKAAGRGDRSVEDGLWERLSAARRAFTDRRKAAYAERDRQRGRAKERKEELIREAEALRESSEWAETARRYRDLMAQWKAAGRAPAADEDELWRRFRAAQDAFFSRRDEAFASRDATQRANLERKQALLARAEALDPAADVDAAQATLRDLQDEWERVGHVPRDAVRGLEDRLRAVEERIRDAVDAKWRRTAAASNPILDQLRRAVSELEERVASAHGRGDAQAAQRLEQELAGRRQLLDHAEESLRSS